MTRFRIPRRPYWLPAPENEEIDFYLRDLIRHEGHFIENLMPDVTENYTRFLNQTEVLYMWNTITNTTIPLPIIIPDYFVTSTRMPNTRMTVEEVYRETYGYAVNYPFSPLIGDVLGRYHPIEVCAIRFQLSQPDNC